MCSALRSQLRLTQGSDLVVWLQNVVQYSGTAEDRSLIRDTEFFFNGERKFKRHTKFEILLASYETVLRDKKVFQAITWQVHQCCSDEPA